MDKTYPEDSDKSSKLSNPCSTSNDEFKIGQPNETNKKKLLL